MTGTREEAEPGPAPSRVAEFRKAVANGSGRAAILLRQTPQDPALNAELLHACRTDLVYDAQCEARRSPYLCELIRVTGRQDAYRQALEDRLRIVTPTDSDWEVQQVFEILAEQAERDLDGEVLRAFVLTTGPEALALAVAAKLVRLQGLDALLACTRRFGPEHDWWLLAKMTRALEQRDGAVAARSALQEARRNDAAFDDRMSVVEAETRANQEPEAVPDYATLKAQVGRHRYFPHAWVVGASQEEIERAANDLLAETDPERVLAYLSIFRTRPFPGDPVRLLPRLTSTSRRIAFSVAGVLARISHPAIHDGGLRLLAAGQFELGARLFRSSHGDGDLVQLGAVLDQLSGDTEAYHDVGFSILGMIQGMSEKPAEARTVLLHLYRNGPCSKCRGAAVDQLAITGGIPDWMVEEGCWDAEPSIAERFRKPAP